MAMMAGWSESMLSMVDDRGGRSTSESQLIDSCAGAMRGAISAATTCTLRLERFRLLRPVRSVRWEEEDSSETTGAEVLGPGCDKVSSSG